MLISHGNEFKDAKSFANYVNNARKKYPDQWYSISGEVHINVIKSKKVKLKGFGTWLQVFEVDGVNCSSPMNLNATQFKNHIKTTLEETK